MRRTITSRGQTVVPAPIRERFSLGPASRLEWIADTIAAFRGSGAGGSTARLLAVRDDEAGAEPDTAIARNLAWLGNSTDPGAESMP
jgi:hypothetical protein